MTRGVAILVLLVSAANAALPALLANPESDLPACCRRNGNHRCSMMPVSAPSGPSFAAVRTKCPLYPRGSAFGHHAQFTPAPHSLYTSAIEPREFAKQQTQSLNRLSHSRVRRERGPPLLLF